MKAPTNIGEGTPSPHAPIIPKAVFTSPASHWAHPDSRVR